MTRTQAIDRAYEEIERFGVRPTPFVNGKSEGYEPGPYAEMAVAAFDRLADRLTVREMEDLRVLLESLRYLTDAEAPYDAIHPWEDRL